MSLEVLASYVERCSVLAFVLLRGQGTAFPAVNDGSSTGKSRWSRDHFCLRSPKFIDWQSLRDYPFRMVSPKTAVQSMVEPFQCFIRRRFVPIWCPKRHCIHVQNLERPVGKCCLHQGRGSKPCSCYRFTGQFRAASKVIDIVRILSPTIL